MGMYKIGFMASGNGSNLAAILSSIHEGNLPGVHAEFLISNNSQCKAMQIAHSHGLRTYHRSSQTHPQSCDLDQSLIDIVDHHQIDLLVLAGYMKKVPDALLAHLPWRVINVHPALLPSFGGPGHWGMHVHEAVVQAGVRVSGATIHFVDSVYDHGLIVAQRAIPLASDWDANIVADHVLAVEHDLYWRVIAAFAQGLVKVDQGRVHCPVL